jgi:hypothetical protein
MRLTWSGSRADASLLGGAFEGKVLTGWSCGDDWRGLGPSAQLPHDLRCSFHTRAGRTLNCAAARTTHRDYPWQYEGMYRKGVAMAGHEARNPP